MRWTAERSEAMKLSDSALDHFAENGYVVLRNAVSPDLIAAVTERADSLAASDERIFRMSDGEFDGFRNLLFLDSSFLKLVDLERVLVPVIQIMGYNIHLSSLHLSYIYPKPEDRVWTGDWHSDIYGFEDDLREQSVRVSIKCAFPLTRHITEDSGMTILLPGTHKSAYGGTLDLHDAHPPGALQLCLEPGDCLLFENRLRHSRGLNRGPATRKCILIGYSFRWVMPLDSIEGLDLPPDDVSALAGDLLPRPYGVPGNGAITALCQSHDLPLRPAKIL